MMDTMIISELELKSDQYETLGNSHLEHEQY